MRLPNFATAALTFRGDAPSAIVPKYSEVEHPSKSHAIFSHSFSSGCFVTGSAVTCALVVTGPVVTVGSHIGALYVGLKHSVEELDIESPLQLVNFVTHDLMSGALVPKNESTIEPMPIAI